MNNHLVFVVRSERSPISTGEGYRLSTNPRGLLHTQNHILRTSTRAYPHRDIALLKVRVDLSGEDFIEPKIVPDCRENRRVSRQRESSHRWSYSLKFAASLCRNV